MKRWMTIALMAAFAVACSDEPGSDAERAKEEIGEAYEATKDYLAEQKDEFLTSLRSGVDSMEDDLATLRARAEDAGEETQKELNDLVAELEGRKVELESKIDSAAEGASDGWEETKAELDDAWNDLKQDVVQALDDSGS